MGELRELFQRAVMNAGLCALCVLALVAFGAWLDRMGVFAVARRVFWSVRGAFLGLVMFAFVLWAGTKPNLGIFPLQSGGEGTNAVVYVISQNQVDAGYVLAKVGTNEMHDLSIPVVASVHTPWRLRGANRDRFALNSQTNAPWAFPLGTNIFDGLLVTSSGALMPKFVDEPFVPRARRAWAEAARVPLLRESVPVGEATLLSLPTLFTPFLANLGTVPQMNWPPPGEPGARSQFGWWLSPSNSLVLTWNDFLLGRSPDSPVSFQAEFFWNGDFVYRYDLSDGIITNALAGAFNGGYGESAEPSTNLTSLLYRRVVPEDLYVGDRDGDGLTTAEEIFVYGTDPGLPDTDGDGVPDGAEVALGTNPLSRDLSDADILARVETSATNEAFLAESVVATNTLAAWKLLDGFAANWTPGATNVLWERCFPVFRTSAWQQFFVSASPSNAAPWRLEGLTLEWEFDGDDCHADGSLEASPVGDSWRVPLAADDFPTNVTLRLRATGASTVRCPTPLHLAAYAPEFRAAGGQEVTGRSGARFTVFTEGSKSEIQLVVDHSRRPHRAPPTEEEGDMVLLYNISMTSGGLAFDGDLSGGTLTACQPGIYSLPEMSLGITGTTGVSLVGNRGFRSGNGSIIVLSPCVSWLCESHGCGYDGLGYSEEGGYYEEYYYPLDSKCLRKAWYRSWGGGDGWTHDSCEMLVSSGVEEGDVVSSGISDGRGKVYVDGVEVWSGTAEHVYDDVCGGGGDGGYGEDFLGDSCDSCDSGCTDGNCNDFEGTSLGSLRFRIPLGQPVKGQVAGFAWFSTDDPLYISKSTFQVLAHPDAHVADATASGIRRITCGDARGRDLRIQSIANGVRVTIYDTAAQTLEHTWEIWNVDGDPEQVRLKKISRLDNVMSDETFTYDSGDWIRFDNVAQIGTRLSSFGDYSIWGDNAVTETRETFDGAGNPLGTVTTEKSRVGECDNAVLRETYREDYDGVNTKVSQADYWNDPQHAGRHGQPRLVWGNARAWAYTDYDELGHETLRVEQRGNAPVPEAFPYVVSNVLYGASTLANAFVTVRDYEPLSGDTRHADDAAKWRTETRYVVTNGVLTLAARTRTRYTRLTRDGYSAVKRETWRGGAQLVAPETAYSYEITYATTGVGTPLLMRGAVAEALSEDGTLTVNTYSLTGDILTCESRRSSTGGAQLVAPAFPTYEATIINASYGTVLRRTTRLTSNDAIIADEQSIYDNQNRLRSTTYFDGTSLTNAYSCCRLLWNRDRQNRTTLRSAQTGTDHLYNAYEDIWLADLTGTTGILPVGGSGVSPLQHAFRITQHFYDALGRETNTVTYAGTIPGEATTPAGGTRSCASAATTAYPYGGSDYAIHTDERGAQTITSTSHESGYTEQTSYTTTNYTEVLRTTTRTYHGGGSSTRREWLVPPSAGGAQLAAPVAWTEEHRFSEYASNGYRIDYVVTTSSDHPAVTNSISTYDLLGRLVTTAVPAGGSGVSPLQSGSTGTTGVSPVANWLVTSNAYDGATSRILTTTKTGSLPVNYFYDEFGERIGTAQGNKSVWNRTTYETISQEVYRVVTTVRMTGSTTNAVQIQKTQLTGPSNSCRLHTITLTGNAAILAATGTTGVSPVENGTVTDTLTTYDPDTGVETTVSRTDGQTPVVTRSLHGIPIEQTTRDERSSLFYDAFGRNVAKVYENVATGATNRTEAFEYDLSDNAVRRTIDYGADGVAVSTAEYDMLNREVRRTDALGHVTETAYDGLGRPVSVGGDTYPLRTGYDTQDRKTSSSTTRDNGTTWDETQWEFDPASGLNTAKVYADGSRISYDYTDNGQRTRTTWARGAWKQHAYNDRNLVSGTTYSGTARPSVAYSYDDSDKVASVTLSDGTSYAYAYDDSLLCTNEAVTIAEDNFTVMRTYDSFQRNEETAVVITNIRHATKRRLYDSENRVCGYALTNSLGRGVNVTIAYDGSYLTNMVYVLPNGSQFVVSFTRNASRRELVMRRDYSLGTQSVYWYSTDYDLIGRPTNATDSVSLMREWLYNNRSELASATIGTNHYGYSYDTIGNRLWSADDVITNEYAANSLNQYTLVGRAAPSAPQTSLLHDADGNMTRDGANTYSYDAENRLRTVTSRSLTNGALRVLNTYDHRNRRIRKTVQRLHSTSAPPPAPPSGTDEWLTLETHTFVWDGNNIILENVEFADGTTSTFEYFWGMDKSGTEQGAGGVEGLLAVSMNGVFYIPCYDHNGNIVLYVSETGATAAQYTYDPYGNIIESSGSLADVFSFGFSTKYHDRVIGMICYQERVYSPVLGRWLNRDPIEEEGGENLYCFVMNVPSWYFDFGGMHTFQFNDKGWSYADVVSKVSNRSRPIIGFTQFILRTGSSCSCSKGKWIPNYIFVIDIYSQIQNADDDIWNDDDYAKRTNDPRVREKWQSFWFFKARRRRNLVIEHEERHRKHAQKNYNEAIQKLSAKEFYATKEMCEIHAGVTIESAKLDFIDHDNKYYEKVEKGDL